MIYWNMRHEPQEYMTLELRQCDTCTQVRSLSLEVATKLLDVLVVQYPALREAVRSVAGIVMEQTYEAALDEVDDLLAKEKDPFTVRDPLVWRAWSRVEGVGLEAAILKTGSIPYSRAYLPPPILLNGYRLGRPRRDQKY